MALIACKNCGKQISSAAQKCPHCGMKIKHEVEIKGKLTCTECGKTTDHIVSSCPNCGHPFVITPIRIRTYALGGNPVEVGVEALSPAGQVRVILSSRKMGKGSFTFEGAFACTFSALRFYYHEGTDYNRRSAEVTLRCSNRESGMAFEIDQIFQNIFAQMAGKYSLDIEEVPFDAVAPDKETRILESSES